MDTTMNDFRITDDPARRVNAGFDARRSTMTAHRDNAMRQIYVTLIGVLLLAGSDRAAAQQPDQAPAQQSVHARTRIGDSTRQWLQLQSSGTEGSEPLPMPGEEATAAYRRYLESFNSKIPPFFASSLQSQQGSGQGGGAN
jgi:hypothetical protein